MCLIPGAWEGTSSEELVMVDMKNEAGEMYEYKDRRQEIVIIGHRMKRDNIQSLLDECLLTDEEMALGPEKWKETMEHLDVIGLSLDSPVMGSTMAIYKSDRDPASYDEAYNNQELFVESSLDIYKHDLALILYPMFVYIYMKLVYFGHEQTAKEFIAKFGPGQESYCQEHIKNLSFVTKKNHMKGNELMENFNTSQFTVRMCYDTYTQLNQVRKHTLLWKVIQEHLDLDVYGGQMELIPQYDGADDLKITFCDICNQDFAGKNAVTNKQAHLIHYHFKSKFENLIQDRIDENYVCTFSNCNFKTRRKPDIKRHWGAKHRVLEKFLMEYFDENPPLIPGVGRVSARGSEARGEEVPGNSSEVGSTEASLILQPRSSSEGPGNLLSAGLSSKAVTLASRIPVSLASGPPTATVTSDTHFSRSRQEEAEAVASITSEKIIENIEQANIKIIFSNGSKYLVKRNCGQTIGRVVSLLSEKQKITSFDAFINNNPLDLSEDCSSLSGEVRVEPRVLFRLELPSKQAIEVKSETPKTIAEVLVPILAQYNLSLEDTIVRLVRSGNQGSKGVDMGASIMTIDNTTLLVTQRDDTGTEAVIDMVQERKYETIQDKVCDNIPSRQWCVVKVTILT